MDKQDANAIMINEGNDALLARFSAGETIPLPECFEAEDCEAGSSTVPLDEQPGKPVPKAKKPRRRELVTFSAVDLLDKEFPEANFIVPGYIGEGLTILAGRPKVGKSWLALNIAIAVATGGLVLGSVEVDPGSVLYMALEDTERRLKSRLKKVLGGDEKPADLHFATECPPLDERAFDQLDQWVQDQKNPRLIIIDVFNKVRAPALARETPYEADYRALGLLKDYADKTGVAILILHHTRKMSAQDPFDTISGTTGFTGAADAALVLAQDQDGTSLYARGRDIEEISTAVKFDRESGRWNALGERSEIRRSDERKSIISLMQNFPGQSMTLKEVADRLGAKYDNVKKLMHAMRKAGELVQPRRGEYMLPDENRDADADRNQGDDGYDGYLD